MSHRLRILRPGAALDTLLSDGDAYRRCSLVSREVALRFLPETDAGHFVAYLESLQVIAG